MFRSTCRASVSPIRDAQMSGLEVLSGNVPLGQSITGFAE